MLRQFYTILREKSCFVEIICDISLALLLFTFSFMKTVDVISLYKVAISSLFSVYLFQFYNIVVMLIVICRLIDCSIWISYHCLRNKTIWI